MGVYIYKTKPSHVARAAVRLSDGTDVVTDIALYQYAYKPYHGFNCDGDNARMRFRSGVVAAENAYNRSGRDVPQFGLLIGEDGRIYDRSPALFLTSGSVDIYDDYVKYDGAKVLEFLKLPKNTFIQEEKVA